MANFQITYIGHGSNLIRIEDQYFLTDPNFSEKILGFRRRKKPGIDPAQLPPVSAILVSHAHYDHLDLFSYKYFKTSVPILLPKGLGKFVAKFLPNPIVEIPLQSHHVHHGVEIHALPVQHHGYRWIPWRYRAACAYLLKSPQTCLYFCGDSGYGPHFQKVGEHFVVDVAMLPVAGFHPPWLKKKTKMNPEQALQATRELRTRHLIPIGWGIFDFLFRDPTDPIQKLLSVDTPSADAAKIHVLQPGESFAL
jgi:L-ascorbate metabolism protein UlaG (beta-lactamase superfamily)